MLLGSTRQHVLELADGLLADAHIVVGGRARNVLGGVSGRQIQPRIEQVGSRSLACLKFSMLSSYWPFAKDATPLFSRSRALSLATSGRAECHGQESQGQTTASTLCYDFRNCMHVRSLETFHPRFMF